MDTTVSATKKAHMNQLIIFESSMVTEIYITPQMGSKTCLSKQINTNQNLYIVTN